MTVEITYITYRKTLHKRSMEIQERQKLLQHHHMWLNSEPTFLCRNTYFSSRHKIRLNKSIICDEKVAQLHNLIWRWNTIDHGIITSKAKALGRFALNFLQVIRKLWCERECLVVEALLFQKPINFCFMPKL